MRILKLSVQNLGSFGQLEEIEWSGEEGKPVHLIGGRNGAGKTTVLQLIQWVLYGVLSPRTKGARSYKVFLERLYHRYANPTAEAYAELTFDCHINGAETSVRVRRSLVPPSYRTEKLEVWLDDQALEAPESAWPPIMDELLPHELVRFFFFDGEQIKDIAESSAAALFLRTGTRLLLGGAIAEQSIQDLTILERQILKEISESSPEIEDSTALRTRLDELDPEIAKVFDERTKARAELDKAEQNYESTEQAYREGGGKLYEAEVSITEQIRTSEALQDDARTSLRGLADSSLTLQLVQKNLREVYESISKEQGVSPKAAERYFEEFLPQLLASANGMGVAADELEEFAHKAHANVVTELSGSGSLSADEMLFIQATGELFEARKIEQATRASTAELEQIQKHASEIRRLEIQLRNAPSEDELNRLKSEFTKASNDKVKSEAALQRKLEEERLLREEQTKITETLEQQARDASEKNLSLEKQKRTLDSVKATKTRISEFQALLLTDNLKVIEGHIEDRCSQLLRKNHLVAKFHINPETFAPKLLDDQNEEVEFDDLSAGERQLVATAMIWGLADASGREIPLIVDTPLGRLDDSHRHRLAESYYPNASHQVILLSTDTEIVGKYRETLTPAIASQHSFALDEETRSTRIETGYFQSELEHAV